MSIKKGTVLTAINPCVMQHTGTESLTVGKDYEVIDVVHGCLGVSIFAIIDDLENEHEFTMKPDDDGANYKQYFKIKHHALTGKELELNTDK